MQILPAGELRRDDLLGIAQLPAELGYLVAGFADLVFFLFVKSLAGFIEEAERPAGGAREGVVGALD